jgi:hypothetical protein
MKGLINAFGGLIKIMPNKTKLLCNTTFRITIIYKILFLKQIKFNIKKKLF